MNLLMMLKVNAHCYDAKNCYKALKKWINQIFSINWTLFIAILTVEWVKISKHVVRKIN